MDLVIGTYHELGNPDLPKPAQSQYFKTRVGAIQLVKKTAGFRWIVDVVKHPEQRIYYRVLFEYPYNAAKPFVREGAIDPETPKISAGYGPVQGLVIGQEYTFELIVYADEKRTQEIDRLAQKVHSYVDTTEAEAKLFSGMTKFTQSPPKPPPPVTERRPDGVRPFSAAEKQP